MMRNVWKCGLGLLVGLGVWAGNAGAQFKNGSQPTELNIPRLSQRGTVSQRLGLTDITITYHRPEVGGREIWGKTVPYGKVWRAGANENTTITLTDDVSIEGKPLAAGTYGLHTIPDKDQWTIIFSKNATSWGSFSYDEKEDALRVTAKPQAADFREALTYTFEEVKPDSAAATLRWEKLAVPFHISVDVKAVVLRSVRNELRSVGGFTWGGYDEAFENLETKSRILDVLGRKEESAKVLSKAFDKANAIQLYSYARGLQRSGNAKRAFELYPQVPKKDANHWISHLALARISSNTGDFPTAAKEMTMAISGAPDATKLFLQPLLKRLEAKDDINK